MKKIILAGICAVVLAGCGSKDAKYDKAAETSLKDAFTGMFNELSVMNFEALRVTGDVPELVVYDLDSSNKPLTAMGASDWNRVVDEYAAAAKSGAKMETILRTADCHAVSNFGYCTGEFDQSMAMGGRHSGPFMMRGTLVAKKAGGKWQWVHWHASFRQMPAPAKVVRAPAKPRAKAPARTTKASVKKKATTKKR